MAEHDDIEARVARLEREVAALRGSAVAPTDAPLPRDHVACVRCGVAIPPRARFCPGCGSAQERTRTVAPAVNVPAAAPRAIEADRIGAYLARGGTIVLLAGIAFGFKLAIDRGWIGPWPRVLIAFGVGAGLMLYSERARARGWLPLAAALTGGGGAICYLSILAASELYELIARPVMFAGLIAIVATVGVIATRRASEPLALLATIGALLNPLLLMEGGTNREGVMVYLIAINAAALTLARRRWQGVETASLLGTITVFAIAAPDVAFVRAALYATVLLAIVIAVPLLRLRLPADPADAVPSIGAGLAYLWLLIDGFGSRGADAVAALAVGAAFAGLALLVRGRAEHVAGAWMGMTAASVAIAASAGLNDRASWVAWSIQGALVFWYGLRHRLRIPAGLGLTQLAVATFAGVAALLEYDPAAPFLNPETVGFLLQAAGLAVATMAAARFGTAEDGASLTPILGVGTHAFTLWWLSAEVWHLAGTRQLGGLAISALWVAYGATLVVLGIRLGVRFHRQAGLLVFAALGTKLVTYDLTMLEGIFRVAAFLGAGAILVGCGIAYQRLRD